MKSSTEKSKGILFNEMKGAKSMEVYNEMKGAENMEVYNEMKGAESMEVSNEMKGAKGMKASNETKRGKIIEDEKKKELSVFLTKKLVITNKKPSKETERLCKQLRYIFSPDNLSSIKKENLSFRQYLELADHYQISHIIIVNRNILKIGVRTTGITYKFKIVEYIDNFKNFNPSFYLSPPFVTFEGKSVLKPIFAKFGKNKTGFKRVLHVEFESDLIYIRHYAHCVENNEDSYKVKLKEIGPRLTLSLLATETGLFSEFKKQPLN